MIKLPASSSVLIILACVSLISLNQASALPVAYNQTSLNFGFTSIPRNSSSYDVFPLIPDNWLWEKFDNNTIDSSPLNVTGTITYNTNLKALWKGENTTLDSTSNAFTLTKINGTNSFTTGQEGKAFSFDGNTSYSASSSALPTGTNDRSVSFWIFTPNTFVEGKYIFAQGATTNNNLFAATWAATNGISKLLFQGFNNDVTSNTTFQPNTWYYITLTLGSTGTVRTIYVNGALDIQSTTTALNTTPSTFYFASGLGNPVGSDFGAGGKLDEFRTYNTVLTLQQHQALYMVGHYSQSHTFDGGEYVGLGTSPWNWERTQPFTVSTWIKGSNAGVYETFIGNTLLNVQGWTIYSNTDNHLEFTLYGNTAGQYLFARANANIRDGIWHYIAVTYDGSSDISGVHWYIDGIAQTVINIKNNLASSIISSNPVKIGNGPDNGSPFTGQLDNLKVYPYALSSSQINSDYNSISPISSGKQFMSYYHGVSGSSTLTNKLGFGATTTLSCNLGGANLPLQIVSNMSNIYYGCGGGPLAVEKFDIVGNTNTHVYSSTTPSGWNLSVLFMGIKHIFSGTGSGPGFNYWLNSEKGNVTQGGTSGTWTATNQQINIIGIGTSMIKFNDNSTSVRAGSTANQCNINFKSTNTTKALDSIACDQAVPAPAIKYWNGMAIQGIGNYVENSTQQFLNSIDASAYKKLLSLPCVILVNESPCVDFILTDSTQTDYLIVLTSTHVYYVNALNALHVLTQNNYALQSYDVVTTTTTSAYEIPNPILQDMTLYGFSLNTTIHKTGMFTLPSGYSLRTTTISPSIRLIDPRWSDDATDMPIISSTSSLFPIFLTISNAPSFSAIKVTQGNQIINSQESVWAIAQLDSTRSVEFDLPSGTCANIYVADISVSPSIWNFEGIVCATGLNQKTVSYTNTLPISFWTSKYSATHSYTPSSNILTVTTRATTGPYTENIIIKNSNGTTVQNYTNTVNGTIDTPSFNVTTVGKPLTLYVNINGNPIYEAFLGSAVSFASVSSFFSTYFSYHGFNLLSLIPIIFAGMFTRNSVGIGAVAVVLLIASLNFFSLVVIPETVITVMLFISLIGLIAYRVILY